MSGRPRGSALDKTVLCIGSGFTRSPRILELGVKVAANIDAALAVASPVTQLVVCDLRTVGAPGTGFKRLRSKFPRGFLIGVVATDTPIHVKLDSIRSGCDDFIVLPNVTSPEEGATRLLESLNGWSMTRRRVLVVDDDPNNRELLRQQLTDANLDVVLAEDGPSALRLVVDVDLVLLDIMMPGMDGREVCRALRSNKQYADLPIVVLSALDQIKDKLAALDLGANDYVTKPFDGEQLVTKIRRLLLLGHAQRQLQRTLKRHP